MFAVVVPKPKEKTPVPLLYASGYVAESDVDETLELNVVQSVLERYPLVVPFDCAIERTFEANESGALMVLAMMEPFPLVPRSADARLVMARLVVVALASVVLPVNALVPEKVLLFASKVVEAMVMLAEPSKETPLMVRGVASVVAVLALPLMLPAMVLVKVCVPAQVLEVVVPKPKEKSPAPLYESGYVAESDEKVGSPNDDVATGVYAVPPALPMRRPLAVTDERPVPPFDTPSVPVRRLVPMDVVATTCPVLFVLRRPFVIPASVS